MKTEEFGWENTGEISQKLYYKHHGDDCMKLLHQPTEEFIAEITALTGFIGEKNPPELEKYLKLIRSDLYDSYKNYVEGYARYKDLGGYG